MLAGIADFDYFAHCGAREVLIRRCSRDLKVCLVGWCCRLSFIEGPDMVVVVFIVDFFCKEVY